MKQIRIAIDKMNGEDISVRDWGYIDCLSVLEEIRIAIISYLSIAECDVVNEAIALLMHTKQLKVIGTHHAYNFRIKEFK